MSTGFEEQAYGKLEFAKFKTITSALYFSGHSIILDFIKEERLHCRNWFPEIASTHKYTEKLNLQPTMAEFKLPPNTENLVFSFIMAFLLFCVQDLSLKHRENE